ncbi:MAG: M48 family metallopeptidase [Ignavibacteriae bacterium]|nr:M48 family metallopeptidase [Ignavibacteriota bacterium]
MKIKKFTYSKLYISKDGLSLIMTPLFVIDYLIYHELIHLKIMNHSKEYWLRLSLLYPDYKEANQWLKKFGGGLFY